MTDFDDDPVFAVTVLKHSLPPVLIVRVMSFSTNSNYTPSENGFKGEAAIKLQWSPFTANMCNRFFFVLLKICHSSVKCGVPRKHVLVNACKIHFTRAIAG